MPLSPDTKLPDLIPLFPVEGALLLPGGLMPLRIFEPRYIRMVEDALKTSHRLIGMIQPRHDNTLYRTGCAGRINGFQETADGGYRITLTGVSRFAVLEVQKRQVPYRVGLVKWCGFAVDREPKGGCLGIDRDMLTASLCRYFTQNGLTADWDTMKQTDDEKLITALAMICPFTPAEKQALLEAPCCKTRAELLMALLDMTVPAGVFDNDGAPRQH